MKTQNQIYNEQSQIIADVRQMIKDEVVYNGKMLCRETAIANANRKFGSNGTIAVMAILSGRYDDVIKDLQRKRYTVEFALSVLAWLVKIGALDTDIAEIYQDKFIQ